MNKSSTEILLRADASESIGTGHVMRCLALAQAWKRAGGTATFAMSRAPAAVCERLRTDGFRIVSIEAEPASLADARETGQRAIDLGAHWVVLDGDDFNARYQATLRESDLCALVIDDEARAPYFAADLLLNHNAFATPELYAHKADGARLALGGRFALLRKEFEPWRMWRREIPPRARRLLITMGSCDSSNATQQVLQGLDRLGDTSLEIQIVVGSASTHRAQVEHEAAARNARVVVDARNMPELMAWADIAITTAGSTCWEMAFMGTPTLTLVNGENQERIANYLCERGAAQSLGRADRLDLDQFAAALKCMIENQVLRTTLSRAGRRLIDGRGAGRVVVMLREAA